MSRGRRDWIGLLRRTGVLAICLSIPLGMPRLGPPRRHGLLRDQFTRTFITSFRSAVQPASWGVCSAAAIDFRDDEAVLDFECTDGAPATVVLVRRGAEHAIDCGSGAGGALPVQCVISGRRDPAGRQQLLDQLGGILRTIAVGDPFETVLEIPTAADLLVTLSMLALILFLWLVATGAFGNGGAERSDWVAAGPFLIALVVREGLTLHSVEQIEIGFANGGFLTKHSLTHPLIQLFYEPFLRESQAFTQHVGGILGALATIPLFVFVRRRANVEAALLGALLFAAHPLIARFAPTDGDYSLLLLSWFSGLALLSDPKGDGHSVFAGIALLGLAASCRMEGALVLPASLAMLEPGGFLARGRRHPRAVLGGALVFVLLVGTQQSLLHYQHIEETTWATIFPGGGRVLTAALWEPPYANRVIAVLLAAGLFAGVVSTLGLLIPRARRASALGAPLLASGWTLGLGTFIALVIFVVPFKTTGLGGELLLVHRWVPVCALQAVLAGLGGAWLLSWLPGLSRSKRAGLALVLGLLAGAHLLVPWLGLLREPALFTEEYDLLRKHLGHNREAILISHIPRNDTDLHDLTQVLPDARYLDSVDPRAVVPPAGARTFYFRSASCFFHPEGMPARCSGPEAADASCLSAPCAEFEARARLRLVESRVVDLTNFRDGTGHYPGAVVVGLYAVSP